MKKKNLRKFVYFFFNFFGFATEINGKVFTQFNEIMFQVSKFNYLGSVVRENVEISEDVTS